MSKTLEVSQVDIGPRVPEHVPEVGLSSRHDLTADLIEASSNCWALTQISLTAVQLEKVGASERRAHFHRALNLVAPTNMLVFVREPCVFTQLEISPLNCVAFLNISFIFLTLYMAHDHDDMS